MVIISPPKIDHITEIHIGRTVILNICVALYKTLSPCQIRMSFHVETVQLYQREIDDRSIAVTCN